MAYKKYDIVLLFPPIRTWDNPRNFPTGLGLIAAQLRSAGYRVAVIDVNGLRLSDEEVLEQIRQYNPSVIGMGGLITTYGWVKRMSRQIRRTWPDKKIVLGGSVGTSIIETALRNLSVDVIAVGEADQTILELLAAILNGKNLDMIAGLAYLQDDKVVQTPSRELLENPDELPYPAWDLFPMQIYLTNPVVGVGRDIDIISSRGCPFNCRYCYRIFGRKFRGRSAEHVVGEMLALKRNYDVDFISFQDDCFVVDKQRVFKICDLIDKEGLNQSLRWSCTGRVTVCDKELLQRMRSSGCISVSYGIESGSEKILQAMSKNASLEQAKQAIDNTRAVGLRCPVSFMIGYPGETRGTVLETVEFCRRMNIPLTALMFTCPYPGTALYDQVKDSERFRAQFASEEEFVLRMGDAVDLTVNLTDMNDEELKALREEALRIARQHYQPPSPEQVAAQEKELYGERLYHKAHEQLQNPQMQAHRRRHGFNESLAEESHSGYDLPGWVTGRACPYIIAEAGVNHNGRLDTALQLVEAAQAAGADCIKFQAFSADELTLKDAQKAEYQMTTGREGESQYNMLSRCELSVDDFQAIKNHCDKLGIDFLVTPFSPRWVKKFADMKVAAYKIGSGNLGVARLLKAVGKTARPVLVSTGMAEMDEISLTLNQLRTAGSGILAVLQCVSLYPTRLDQVNLNAISVLARQTNLKAGFSDHTEETITGALAVAAGADILEKHFTLDKTADGPDHRISLEPQEMQEYIRLARQAWAARGSGKKQPLKEELKMKEAARMSVVTKTKIEKGTRFTWENLTVKRPGTGIPAERIHVVINSKAAKDLNPDEIVKPQDVEFISHSSIF